MPSVVSVVSSSSPVQQDQATKELPFCNTNLSIGARLHDLIGRLSLQEKAGPLALIPSPAHALLLTVASRGLTSRRICIWWRRTRPLPLRASSARTSVPPTFIGPTGLGAAVNRGSYPRRCASNNLNWHRGGGVLQKIGLTDPFLSGYYAAPYVTDCQDGPDKKYEEKWQQVSGTLTRTRSRQTAWHSTGTSPPLISETPSINGVPSCANNMLLNDVVRGQLRCDLQTWSTPTSTPVTSVDAVAKTLHGGEDMELRETYFTTNGNLAQAVQQNRTAIDTVHNTVRRVLKDSFITGQMASMSARPVDPSLTSSNGPCISECPDGGHELGNGCAECHSTRQPHQSCIAHCPLNYYAKDHHCVPCTTCGMGTWASAPCTSSSDAVCCSWTERKPGQKESVSGNAYPPLPDRASCFPTSVCEEPFIETIPPTLTTDRLCSCDTLTCNKLITQLFEEMVCAEPTDEQLDVVLDVCCSSQGEDGIRDTIRQMDAYEARRSCPDCTDTCECSAGFILVDDADSANCRPCDGVTEFSPSIGGSKREPIEECECGQEEVSAPTRCSSDGVCRDCSAGTIDSDSDGSTGCHMCPTTHYTEAGCHGSCSSFTCRAGTHDHDSDPATLVHGRHRVRARV
ncbi:hypothetical protein PTSG_09094 [Salpingoeca rosetta]|uniref:TNFR-Cys domain-containing protein n=1 Tax=Salpingoeca rosetta (strain ATCC 50818 / BSB-021) TaxID=946362 RepID=F2UM70_SALR5|nr:uncharacterized protein PTSG_09094 [Salpingoeca rosetta]EGD78219.1 hypothetical protein PTSG_09094 [Salpingoeca rosetta]|eukprot:XP_004989895.1 hypothetical protein PTSG_09094 [Salpingoeca rosetta]